MVAEKNEIRETSRVNLGDGMELITYDRPLPDGPCVAFKRNPDYIEIGPMRDQFGRVLLRRFNDTLSQSTFSVSDGQTIEGQLEKCRAAYRAAASKAADLELKNRENGEI